MTADHEIEPPHVVTFREHVEAYTELVAASLGFPVEKNPEGWPTIEVALAMEALIDHFALLSSPPRDT
jgi:hypothetical protein